MLQVAKRVAVAVLALSAGVAVAETRLQGAGATFPNPIYQRWVTDYQAKHPDVKIDYQSIGSGGGVKGIVEKTLDFGGSDAPMSKGELEKAGGAVIHIPTVAGAVVPAYNLSGFKGDLKLSGPVLCDIYMGKITKWNDPAIAAMNEGAALPATPITVAYRTDGSGTTYVWSSYLATQSEEYKSSIGAGKQVKWPVGQGGKGNEGVTAIVQSVPGAIGYIEVNYATANKIPFALVKNKAGKFIKASPETISAAGAGALEQMKKSLAVNIWDQAGENAYPVSAFTYFLIYQDLNTSVKSAEKAQALVDFISWSVHDGQKTAKEMDYAPLADGVVAKVDEALATLKYDGNAVKAAK
ncbi:MAG TPA: phosphate ABC transporter substrate-binding protein PstS [Roseimicrobium sp.]|nr:phosphate ABC transporter substrate-binding protein PstS [Roseimicrobium sp.]